MLAGKHSREKQLSSTDERLAERRKKWADDTHIINSAIKEIEAKATELQVRISFEHSPGRPGWVTIGSASSLETHQVNSINKWFGMFMKTAP